MRKSQQVIKNYMWTLIKNTANCIWEKIEIYSEKKYEFSKKFIIDYKSLNFTNHFIKKKIIFEVYFFNEENISAKIRKINNKEFFINIYLPNTFGIYGKNKKITKHQAQYILSRKKQNMCKLIRSISHEVTHTFDPLFNNIFYTKYYSKKYKSLMSLLEDKIHKQQKKDVIQLYYDSEIELTALTGELEAKAMSLRDSGISKEDTIRSIFIDPEDISDFEKHLQLNRYTQWLKIQRKVKNTIELIYSDKNFYSFK